MRRAPCHAERRGFVLPIVILLMLVVGTVAAVMLTRADVQARDIRRQVDAYAVYHSVQGLRQVLDSWVQVQRARSIRDVLDEDGLAMWIEPGDGTRLSIYLFDAQGLIRSETAGVPEEAAADLELVLTELRRAVGTDAAVAYTREVGPWQISINSAPRAALVALASGVVGSQYADSFAGEVIKQRETGEPVDRSGLDAIMSSVGVPDAERAKINDLIAVEPTLWEFVVDVEGAGAAASQGVLTRFRALVVFPAAAVTQQAFERPSPFLSWETDDPRTYSQVPPRPRTPQQ